MAGADGAAGQRSGVAELSSKSPIIVSDVFEFGPDFDDFSMIDACGVERPAYSKEAPRKSPIINSSANHEGTGSCSKHHSGKHGGSKNGGRTLKSKRRKEGFLSLMMLRPKTLLVSKAWNLFCRLQDIRQSRVGQNRIKGRKPRDNKGRGKPVETLLSASL